MIFQILIYCVYVFFHFNIAHLNIVPSSDNKLKEFKNHSIKMLDNFSLEATRTPKDIADLELSGSELICGIRPLVLHKKCLDPAKNLNPNHFNLYPQHCQGAQTKFICINIYINGCTL